jgi:hypothetical protein
MLKKKSKHKRKIKQTKRLKKDQNRTDVYRAPIETAYFMPDLLSTAHAHRLKWASPST